MKKTLLLIILAAGASFLISGEAKAANAADFNPGYIIDDYVFYNSNAMDANQIQNFLNSKNPNCDYYGTQPASDWGYPNITHAQLAEHKRNGTNGFSRDTGFHAPPYRCLTMYAQDTPQMPAASGLCGGIPAYSNRSAAQIIKDVSTACNINPQVLVILLEKEQSLVTDRWPLNRQLEKATGFACPDTAPCNPAYGGFFYQVYYAARQFKVYQAYPNNYNYIAGRNNTIKWNPQSSCGTSSVYIQNQATAALYIYTPYRPNQAALNNLYGTGDGCSSYGNRNFWRIFTDWFGSTKVSYQGFDTPRWMTITSDVHKKVPGTGQNTVNDDFIIPAGTQLRFVSKIYINGQMYYRTAYDHDRGLNQGIPATSVGEIPYLPFETVRWMNVTAKTEKIYPGSDRLAGQTIEANTRIKFVEKMYINNKTYYRSEYDKLNNRNFVVSADNIVEASYENFIDPRIYHAPNTVTKQNPITGVLSGENIVGGTYAKYSKKITLGDKTYCQLENDAQAGSLLSVDCTALSELSYAAIDNGAPYRWVQLKNSATKVRPATGSLDVYTYSQGLQVQVAQYMSFGGQTYYRSKFDTEHNNDLAFRSTDIEELAFVAMERPRTFTVKQNLNKVNPITGANDPYLLLKGREVDFSSKVLVGNEWYLRSSYDTNGGNVLAIPSSLLSE